MSIVGTRPPTLDEWNKYELHHRARLAIKPGITGMWQVSGRSEITDFEEVVKLDTEYISEWNVYSSKKKNLKEKIHDGNRQDYFKEKIKEEFEEKVHTKKENVIRCNRGEAVITEGGKLCKYVIHTVGPKSDRRKGRLDGYSSSCVGMLVSCYENVIRLVFEYPEIETIAIPVVSSGKYGFEFEYAFRIGLVTVYIYIFWRKDFHLNRKKKTEFFILIILKRRCK